MRETLDIVRVRDQWEIRAVQQLLGEYAHSLGVDLDLQGFSADLADLPGVYGPPTGELLLLRAPGAQAGGCVGLRALDRSNGICEMKRLYVREGLRGLGAGKRLVSCILQAAAELGYVEMRLDTLHLMTAAIALYRRFGFTEIAPYHERALPGMRYFSKSLSVRSAE